MLSRNSYKFCSKLNRIFEKKITDLPRMKKHPKKIRESLKLYREVLKFCKEFEWMDEQNEKWSDKIKRSARDEFE